MNVKHNNICMSLIIVMSAISLTGCMNMIYTPLMDDSTLLEYEEISESTGMNEAELYAIDQVRYNLDYEKANPRKTIELYMNISVTKGGHEYNIKSYNDYLNVMKTLSIEPKNNIVDALDHLNSLKSNRDDLSVNMTFKTMDEVMEDLQFDEDQKEWARTIFETGMSISEYGESAVSNYDLSEFKDVTFVHPSPDARIVTSPFGYRIHPTKGTRKFHRGVDLACNGNAYGLPVLAIYDGVISKTGYEAEGGNYIFVGHKVGNRFIKAGYMHLSRVLVTNNQNVKRGDVIGYIGSTGTSSTGAHLHFSIYIDGELTDPMKIINH